MNNYHSSWLSRQVTKAWSSFCYHTASPVVVNACLYYSWGRLMPRNWGDDANVFFVEQLTHRRVVSLYQTSPAWREGVDNYLIVGSTITLLTNPQTVVWGAGVIDPAQPLRYRPREVRAVRGPLSRDYLLSCGVACPAVYGDPVLLLPRYYRPRPLSRRYRLGVIPHYSDFDSPLLASLRHDDDVLFIRMEGYRHWTEVVDGLASCERIVSSSLHGLILAEAYGIPNLWAEVEGRLLGGHFKFHDFFLSRGADRPSPVVMSAGMRCSDFSASDFHTPSAVPLQPLLDACPFALA